MTCGVYLLSIENYFYVGHSFDIEKRFQRHLNDLKNRLHHSIYFQRVFDKHKVQPKLKILWEAKGAFQNVETLVIVEQCYINILNSKLNIAPANNSRKGFKARPETIEKLKESHLNCNAKNFTLFHPSLGPIKGFNLHKFCKEKSLSSGALTDVIKGKKTQSKLYFRSEKDYIQYCNKKFKFPGVSKVKDRFRAKIKVNSQTQHLGYYANATEAYEAVIVGKQIFSNKD